MKNSDSIYDYNLLDDDGSSVIGMDILLPVNTIFRHELGVYKVSGYYDDNGRSKEKFEEISIVDCERVLSNKEIESEELDYYFQSKEKTKQWEG